VLTQTASHKPTDKLESPCSDAGKDNINPKEVVAYGVALKLGRAEY